MWQLVRQVTGKQKRSIDILCEFNIEDLNSHFAAISTEAQYRTL